MYNQNDGFGNFARNASGGSLTWGYPLSYEARAFLTYKLETVKISTGSSGFTSLGATRAPIVSVAANLFRGGVTSSFRASLRCDTRNNGLLRNQRLDYGFVSCGRWDIVRNRFFRWGGFARHYQPLWPVRAEDQRGSRQFPPPVAIHLGYQLVNAISSVVFLTCVVLRHAR